MPENLSDTQASDVLRRAALLQARSEHEVGVGLSLDELKRAAEAAGIEGRYVEQAYLGAGEEVTPSEPFLGIPTGAQRVRVVPGQVSEEEWGQMVLALRREFGNDGAAETLGGVREWKWYQTRVQLESDGPNTRITASSQWESDAKGLTIASMFYAVFAAVLAGIGVADGSQGPISFAILLVVVGLVHAGYAWGPLRTRASKRGPQLDRAIDALERLAGADERAAVLAVAPPAPEASGDDGSRLDASLLDADPLSDTGAARQRLRE